MIEVLVCSTKEGFLDDENGILIQDADESVRHWLENYLHDRRVVMSSEMAEHRGYVPGSKMTYMLEETGDKVRGTMPISLDQLTKSSAIDGHGYTVIGGMDAINLVMPFCDVMCMAISERDFGRGKILVPEFPLHSVKWFPEPFEGLWVFRGLSSDLVQNKAPVSGIGALELPLANISHP